MNETQRRAGEEAPHYSARDVRGGEIILRSRVQRLIFIAGLVGLMILALVLGIAGLR